MTDEEGNPLLARERAVCRRYSKSEGRSTKGSQRPPLLHSHRTSRGGRRDQESLIEGVILAKGDGRC